MFTGPNGSGKTNLLEAFSLLVPGRGLRGARPAELARRGADASGLWAVAGQFGPLAIGTGTMADSPERRVFLVDGATPRRQSDVAALLAAVWLTPQMDRLFTDPASGRRKFLDRLVVALEPSHARDIAAFEAAAAQRNRLLAENPDPAWLAGLEDSMARHAVAATAARAALAARMNSMLETGAAAPFPAVRLALDCAIASRLATSPALAVEEYLREAFAASRAADAGPRQSAFSPQRTDLAITDMPSGRPAALSSTGQQKAMLIGIVLGHAALITQARGTPPFLLLDEPLVHLDDRHRQALFAALARLNLSAWLTGTDAAPFATLQGAACYTVRDSHISPA